MAISEKTSPIEDSVAKVDDDIAVGADLEFQRKWWRFTRILWYVFALIIAADLLGCFGRGYLAGATMASNDNSVKIMYERIERFSTPSIMRIEFGPGAVHEKKIKLWVSDTLVKPLGNQRVIPQPVTSTLDHGGILYTFDVQSAPATVEFALEPAAPGIFDLSVKPAGESALNPRIYVMP